MRKISLICLITLMGELAVAEGEPTPSADKDTFDTWPQWRGPTRDGRVPPAHTWPDNLQSIRPAWRIPLHPGYPGPVVAEDRVFVAETKDARWERVRALDRDTGHELWTAQWEGAMNVPFFARSNGDWIRSTPAYDGGTLFVAGMRDLLVALDAQSGAVKWKIDFVQRYNTPLPNFGFVCSPLVVGPHIYVQAGAAFIKLDKYTGQTIWRTLKDEGGMYGSVFSSPIIATVHGTPQLVAQMRENIAGVDPRTGNVLWSATIPAFRRMNVLTPVVFDNHLLTSTYGGKTILHRIDVHQTDAFRLRPQWARPMQGNMSNPAIIDGHLYLHMRNQRMVCIDLQTGEDRWTTTQRFGKYMSLAVRADKILALDQRGELLLIRANPEKFDLLDRRTIADQETWGHLAIVGDEIFVRELNAIAKYHWTAATPTSATAN